MQYCCPGACLGHIIDAGQMFVVVLQITSHLHEFTQLTGPHDESEPAPEPVQVAVHSPMPQFNVPQAARPPVH